MIRVLFVDDEPNVRFAFRRLLLRDGIDADLAESGAEALELARDSRYSVVVTDLNADGRPDLAVSNLGSNDVSLLFSTCSP